jgi:hypothetical protein
MCAEIKEKFTNDLIEYLGKESFEKGKLTIVHDMPTLPRWVSGEYNIDIAVFQDRSYSFACAVKKKWYFGHGLTIAHAAREAIYSMQRKSSH